MKQTISTGQAPKAIGPYSQAVVYGGLAYLSGQIPTDPATNQLVEGDIAAQTGLDIRSAPKVDTAGLKLTVQQGEAITHNATQPAN